MYGYNTSNPSFSPPSNHLCTYWNSVAEKEDEIKIGLEDTANKPVLWIYDTDVFNAH
jgi:hypothetical protein